MLQTTKSRLITSGLLLAVLAIGSYLRLSGITWGLQRGYHPDEVVSMRGVMQLDPLRADFTAPAAYFEGTFNYYLWSLPVAAVRLLHSSNQDAWPPKSEDKLDPEHYGRILLLSRLMTVAFGTATVLAVFLAAREAVGKSYPALAAAFLYAIIPVQVIYAHFMRPHVLADLLCTVVLWLSFKLRAGNQRIWLLSTGFFSGLTAATRYPLGIIVMVPCFCSLFAASELAGQPGRRWLRSVQLFLKGPVWWITLGLLLGLFLGVPMIFIDPGAVVAAFLKDSARFIPLEQFSGWHFIDLAAVWKYLTVLISCGTWPALWIPFYAAIIYLLFSRKVFHITVPLFAFCACYLYFMAKGYSTGLFARATMPLFPCFCIFAALAWHQLFERLHPRPEYPVRFPPTAETPNVSIRALVITCFLLLSLPSLAFDLAYVRGMQEADPRILLQADLKNSLRMGPLKFGVERSGGYFYTLFPLLKQLKSEGLDFALQQPQKPADGYLVALRTPNIAKNRRRLIRQIEARSHFQLRFVKSYGIAPHFLGYWPNLWSFPPDMTYPFFEILLFRERPASGIPHPQLKPEPQVD